jgi:F420-dependent oxidoreductase-like protein
MSVKFGIYIELQLGFDYTITERIALEAEKGGYDSLWCSDHLFMSNESVKQNSMEVWTVLSALASKTSKIRLGPLVACNSYRHPPLLAKIAATLDIISNGRLFFGFGAGWKEIEYKAYGYPFPSIQDRMDQMEEALQIIRLLWTEDKASFKGKHYEIRDAISVPKPIQKPMPPILIGGDGERRTLKAVAKYADYCNLFPVKEIQHKLHILNEHCESVGRDYDNVGKSLFAKAWPGVYVSESVEDLDALYTQAAELFHKPENEIRKYHTEGGPGSWIGFPEDVQERFQYYIDMGFDYFQVMFPGIGEDYIQASHMFAEKVMKKI